MTGDRVKMGPGLGTTGLEVLLPDAKHPTGSTGQFQMFTWAGDRYVIPASAMPLLAAGTLETRLFDVDYLVRLGLDDPQSGSLPLRIEYKSSALHPDLDGIAPGALNGNRRDTAEQKSSAHLFGLSLRTFWLDSRGNGRSGANDPLSQVASIRLGGGSLNSDSVQQGPTGNRLLAAGNGQAGAALPQETLRISALDAQGNQAFALIHVSAVRDFNRFDALYFVLGGQSVSVPAGITSVEANVFTFNTGTNVWDMALVADPQIDLAADATVTLDARTASPVRVQFDQSVQSWALINTVKWSRNDGVAFELLTIPALAIPAAGCGFGGCESFGQISAAPTQPVTVGAFHFSAFQWRFAGAQPSSLFPDLSWELQPQYLLNFPEPSGVPRSLALTTPVGDLAKVHVNLYEAGTSSICPLPGTGYTLAHLSDLSGTFDTGTEVDSPSSTRTDFVFDQLPGAVWFAQGQATDCTAHLGSPHPFVPGSSTTETLGKFPWVPAPFDATSMPDPRTAEIFTGGGLFGHVGTYPCAACRQGNNGEVFLVAGGDSIAGHMGFLFYSGPFTSSALYYEDGVLKLTAVAPEDLLLPMTSGPAQYRLAWKLSRAPIADIALESEVDTVWNFSSQASANVDPMPSFEKCLPDPSQPCTFLPLLLVRYDLPLDIQDRAQAGKPVALRVAITNPSGTILEKGVTLEVSLSFDDGHTWSTAPAPAIAGDGYFTTTVDVPPLSSTNGYVSIRVQATDSNQDSVDQTIIRAFALSAS